MQDYRVKMTCRNIICWLSCVLIASKVLEIESRKLTDGEDCNCVPFSNNTEQCDCRRDCQGENCIQDVNECEPSPCGDNSYCVNALGSYRCECSEAFVKETNTSCVYGGCVGTLTSPHGNIYSPSFFGFNVNTSCSWTIVANQSQVIALIPRYYRKLDDLSSIDIYDGVISNSTKLTDTFKGSPKYVVSSSNYMYITFSKEPEPFFMASYSTYECKDNCSEICDCNVNNTIHCNFTTGKCACKDGWAGDRCSRDLNSCKYRPTLCSENTSCNYTQGKFECVCNYGFFTTPDGTCERCSFHLTNDSGTINSPFDIESNNNNLFCAWTITVTKGYTITLRFLQINVDMCPYDNIEVYDGSSSSDQRLGSHCADRLNETVSSSNSIHFILTTDGLITKRSFMVNYTVNKEDKNHCGHARNKTCLCVKSGWTGKSGSHSHFTIGIYVAIAVNFIAALAGFSDQM